MGPDVKLQQVAEALAAGCREGREGDNLDKLYSQDAISVEAFDADGMGRETRGLDGIKAKHDWWNANMEPLPDDRSPEELVEGPFYFGDEKFSMIYRLKVKEKASGEVMDMTEVATYSVKDGKIVREEFHYSL